MKNIVPDLSSNLSKMWVKIKNIENSLFPELKEQLGVLSTKEEKLIKILDFARIENNITIVKITNTPKDKILIYHLCILDTKSVVKFRKYLPYSGETLTQYKIALTCQKWPDRQRDGWPDEN